ncbi:MAG: hypothetical protein JXJ19_04940 [Elusimicrobia bacterium]|nr:hypothetical protein [Elusimicrobiota bacterium]
MIKINKTIMLMLLGLLLGGCAKCVPVPAGDGKTGLSKEGGEAGKGTFKVDDKGRYIYKNYEFEIISIPPGAGIEWDDRYLGEAPLKYFYNEPMKADGYFIIKAALKDKMYPPQQMHIRNPIPRRITFEWEQK